MGFEEGVYTVCCNLRFCVVFGERHCTNCVVSFHPSDLILSLLRIESFWLIHYIQVMHPRELLCSKLAARSAIPRKRVEDTRLAPTCMGELSIFLSILDTFKPPVA